MAVASAGNPAAGSTVVQAPIAASTPPPSSAGKPDNTGATVEKSLGFLGNLFGLTKTVTLGNKQAENMDKQREAKAYGESVNPTRLAVQYNGYLQAEALNNQCSALDAEGRRNYSKGNPIV